MKAKLMIGFPKCKFDINCLFYLIMILKEKIILIISSYKIFVTTKKSWTLLFIFICIYLVLN